MTKKHQDPNQTSEDGGQDKDLLKSVKDLTLLIAVFLYFAGWIYVYSFFSYFGVSIHDIDQEFYSFLIYSVNVIIYLCEVHIFYFLLSLATLGAIGWISSKRPIIFYLIFLPGLLALTYLTSFYAGRGRARQARISDESNLVPIFFEFSEKFDSKNQPQQIVSVNSSRETKKGKGDTTAQKLTNATLSLEIKNANADTSLRLLAVGKEEYFVLIDNGLEAKDEGNVPKQVYIVKKELVKTAITIKP